MTRWRRHIQCLVDDPTRPILPWLAPRAFSPWPETAGKRTFRPQSAVDGLELGTLNQKRRQNAKPIPSGPHESRNESAKRAAVPRTGDRKATGGTIAARTTRTIKDRTSPSLTAYLYPPGEREKRRKPEAKEDEENKVASPNIFKVYNTFRAPSLPETHFWDTDKMWSGGRTRADDWYEAILGLGGQKEHTARRPSGISKLVKVAEKAENMDHAARLSRTPVKAFRTNGVARQKRWKKVKLVRITKAHGRHPRPRTTFHKSRRTSARMYAVLRYQKVRGVLRRKSYQRNVENDEYTYTVSLGRVWKKVVTRTSRQKSVDIEYLLGDFSSKWLTRIATLKRPYFKEPLSIVPREPPSLDPAAESWARAILSGDATSDQLQSNLMKSTRRHRAWEEALLWIFENDPDQACNFLKITHQRPLPPAYMVGQAVEYLILRATLHPRRQERSESIASVISSVCCRPTYDKLWIDGSHLTWLLQGLDTPSVLTKLKNWENQGFHVPLNTRLHAVRHLSQSGETLAAAVEHLGKIELPSPRAIDHDVIRSVCFSVLRQTVGRKGGHKMCIDAISNLVSIGVNLNVQLCTMVMLNAVRAGDPQAAFNVYDMLSQYGIEPDKYVFAILVQACGMMPQEGERLASVIDTALRKGVLLGSPHVASEVLDALYRHHIKRGRRDTFRLMIESYTQLFEIKPLVELGIVSPTAAAPQPPTVMTAQAPPLGTLIRSFLSHGDAGLHKTLSLYRKIRYLALAKQEPYVEMLRTDHIPNAFVGWFASRVNALPYVSEVIKNMDNDAWEAVNDQPADRSDGAGSIDKFADLTMEADHPVTNAPLPGTPDTCSPAGLGPLSSTVITTDSYAPQRRPTGFSPPTHLTLSILHNILCRQANTYNRIIDQAEHVLQQMLSRGQPIDRRSWTSMTSAYKRVRNYEGALWCVDQMRQTGCWDDEKGFRMRKGLEHLRDRGSRARSLRHSGQHGIDERQTEDTMAEERETVHDTGS